MVDTSTSMAQVLRTFAETYGYDADVYSDSAEACKALQNRFANIGTDGGYDCVVLGWQKDQVRIMSDLLGALGSADHSDLPLIIVSEELDHDVQTIARRRAKTRTLLWRDHKRIEDILEGIVIHEAPVASPSVVQTQSPELNQLPQSVLLVDDTPSVCHVLRDMLESNGYHVTLAGSAAEARRAVAKSRYDLVLTEFFLRNESGEELCRYLKTLPKDKRPVYAVMTRKNLDSVVQRSLAVGAITCLDKSESTEILFARLDAIAKGLSRAAPAGSIASSNSVPSQPVGLEAMVQKALAPSILIDGNRDIVANNAKAASLLAANDQQALQNINFEKTIHGAPVKRSMDKPIKALFRNLTGESLSVAYRSRDIKGAKYGLEGDFCLLSFETVDTNNAVVSSASTIKSVTDQPTVAVKKPSVKKPLPPIEAKVEAKRMLSMVQRALASDVGNSTFSLLMLDVKMVAAVTGDRLSLGQSKPMLDMVFAELSRHYTRKESLAYMGDGRFALLLESRKESQAYTMSQRLIAKVPNLIRQLSDVKLLSHASFIALPRQSDVTARYILQHSTAACLKTELDGLDNSIFKIDAVEKLLPRDTEVTVPAKPAAIPTQSLAAESPAEVRDVPVAATA